MEYGIHLKGWCVTGPLFIKNPLFVSERNNRKSMGTIQNL